MITFNTKQFVQEFKKLDFIKKHKVDNFINNVKFTFKNDKLTIERTNLDVHIWKTIIMNYDKDCSFVVDYHKMLSHVKSIKQKSFSIELREKSIEIKSETSCTVELSDEIFPCPVTSFYPIKSTILKTNNFLSGIEKVKNSVCTDDTRKALNSVYVYKDNENYNIVGCDTRRVAINTNKISGTEKINDDKFLIPLSIAENLNKIFGDGDYIEILQNDDLVCFNDEKNRIEFLKVKENYPNFLQCVPNTDKSTVFEFETKQLKNNLQLIEKHAKKSKFPVRLEFNMNSILLTYEDCKFGTFKWSVSIFNNGINLNYDNFAFSVQLLLDGLTDNEKTYMKLNPDFNHSPVLFESENFQYTLMPYRV